MSRFDKIFEARGTEIIEKQKAGRRKPATEKVADGTRKAVAGIEETVSATAETLNNSSKNSKRGRPTAKRSDPDFVGLTTYIRRDTHTRAKIALLQEGQGRELSELVEDLISSWLSGDNS